MRLLTFCVQWGLFDLADNPLSAFYKGRICVAGDAAHASTPHHGAGAGFCMEDCAVLASLLADERVQGPADLEAVFAAFDATRRERDQWLVRSSRLAADMYEWRAPAVGFRYDEAVQAEIEKRQGYIWSVDLDKAIADGRQHLHTRLAAPSSRTDPL
jgi:salicylate hydroxylase